jgi:hypothetical protein
MVKKIAGGDCFETRVSYLNSDIRADWVLSPSSGDA